jgi:hypothetical protein
LLPKGQLRVSLSTVATRVRVVHESQCPEIGPICDLRPEPPQLHDQRITLLEMRLGAAYALTDALGVEVELPFKVTRTGIRYARLDGTPYTPDYPNIHHRDETLYGPGDPWLLGRGSATAAGFMLTGKLGVSLPLGSTEENPFALGDMGLEHQHIQLGTGTVDPIALVQARRAVSTRLEVALEGRAQLVVYEGAHGYQAGSRYVVGADATFEATPALSLSFLATVVNERAERWDGVILQDGNLGRTDGLMGVGAAVELGEWSLAARVRVPVFQDLNQVGDEAGQLSFPAIVDLSIATSVDLARPAVTAPR